MAKKKTKANDIDTRIAALELRLNTLIVWITQSANSPLSVRDAEQLLNEIGTA